MTDKGHLAHNDLPAEVLTCRTHPQGQEKKGKKGGSRRKDERLWQRPKESRRWRKDGGEMQNKHLNKTKCHSLASFPQKPRLPVSGAALG